MVAVVLAVHARIAPRRRVQPEHEPHRRRLPRPVRAEKPRDDARADREREPVDGALAAVILGDVDDLDHATEASRTSVRPPRSRARTRFLRKNESTVWEEACLRGLIVGGVAVDLRRRVLGLEAEQAVVPRERQVLVGAEAKGGAAVRAPGPELD